MTSLKWDEDPHIPDPTPLSPLSVCSALTQCHRGAEMFGVHLATSVAPAPPAKGRRSKEVLCPPRQGAGSAAEPRGVIPGVWCRGKCVAATTPAHSRRTSRRRESAKIVFPLCWLSRAGLLVCRGPGHCRAWHVPKASPSSLPVPPPHHGQPLAALPSPAARVPLWLDLRKKI